ncbi:MAG: PQQ-dependent sugar dehydrogenase [Polyangiaceae bacterium]
MRPRPAAPGRVALYLSLLVTGCSSCSSGTKITPGPEEVRVSNPAASAGSGETAALPSPRSCVLVKNGHGEAGTVPIRAEVVASGLEVPWGIAFLPGGDALITERPGRVRLLRQGKLLPTPVATLSIGDSGEGGLLGIAAHPDVAKNGFIYLYLTAGNPAKNRVELWRFDAAETRDSRVDVIVEGIPAAQNHDGGRLRFGPDGMLYIGTGDGQQPESAQDPKSLSGKILRLTPDGKVPADNPSPDSPVFISGIRNTQGFDWIDDTTLVISDHGPSGEYKGRRGHDEVSVARAGQNLGWPTIYGCESGAGLVQPSISWEEANPPGGAALYKGDGIPQWRGSLLMGSLKGEHLHRVGLDASGQVTSHDVYLAGTHGRLREVIMGPDGRLWVTTSNCDGRGNCPPDKDRVLVIVR